VLNVFFRDIGQFFGIALQFWFWLTPIIYPADILPAAIKPYIVLNPLASVVAACQQILVQGVWPQWKSLWLVTVVGVLLVLLGLSLFRKHAGDMVDEL